MRASPLLIEYLKRRESFRARPYLDQAGKSTVGFGHLIRPHERLALAFVTEHDAEQLLRADVGTFGIYIEAVNRNLQRKLRQHEFDGLLSLAFNIGLGALDRSTLLRRVKAAEMAAAAAEFDRWVYITRAGADGKSEKVVSKGLVNRRRMDRAIFERGEYAR